MEHLLIAILKFAFATVEFIAKAGFDRNNRIRNELLGMKVITGEEINGKFSIKGVSVRLFGPLETSGM